MGVRLPERSIWTGIKAVYASLMARSPAWEIAETFFNSLTRRVFSTAGVDQAIEFVDTDFDAPPPSAPVNIAKTYRNQSLPELQRSALTDAFDETCWDDLRETAKLASARIEAALAAKDAQFELEIVSSVFYRGRGAYLVGRVLFRIVSERSMQELVPKNDCSRGGCIHFPAKRGPWSCLQSVFASLRNSFLGTAR